MFGEININTAPKKMQLELSPIPVNAIIHPLLEGKNISLSIVRLDMIHPIVSGNKLFKLKYFLEAAMASPTKRIITFGGAYSNHLVATAFACKSAGIKCTGIVRGEKTVTPSHTLQHCEEYGMSLHFLSRSDYNHRQSNEIKMWIREKWGEHILVPDGGYHPLGAKGAAHIMDIVNQIPGITHIGVDIGTATTIAGILTNLLPCQKVTGISALKGMTDIEERIMYLTENKADLNKLAISHEYHFGGYAKKNDILISFMNNLYHEHNIPTDFVYTAKLIYGIIDRIRNGMYPPDSHIACIHGGGLQGNLSLAPGTLIF